MRITLSLAALAATFAVASPAFAQAAPPATPVTASDTAEAKGVVLLPLTLVRSSDLDFGTIIANQNAGGTVEINADSGVRTVSAPLIGVPTFPFTRGLFQGAGPEGTEVTLTFNPPAVLSNGSDTIAAALVLDQGDLRTRTIDSTKAFSVGVGGVFTIKPAQTPGLYSALFEVTAEYPG